MKRTKQLQITISICLILISGCVPLVHNSVLSSGPCEIDSLLLTDNLIPKDLFYETGTRSSYGAPAKVGIEKIGTAYSGFNAGGILHDVYRFANEREAAEEYDKRIEIEYGRDKELTWYTPDLGLTLRADRYRFSCAIYRDGYEDCKLVSQYQVYVSNFSFFYLDTYHELMTSIINSIDAQMVSCINQ